MKKLVIAAAFLLGTTSAFAAESIKATVGHMCCGGCKSAASSAVKELKWVDAVAIDNDVLTVTAKGDQKVDLVTLTDALQKSGFPARPNPAAGAPLSVCAPSISMTSS